MAMPEDAAGFALLWPTQTVRLAHRGGEAELSAGDLTLIDRQASFLVIGDNGWTADLLELGDIGSRIFSGMPASRIGHALDGKTPLASLIKRVWVVGQDVAKLALADDVTTGHLVALIGNLTTKLLTSGYVDRGHPTTSHRVAMVARAEMQISLHFEDPAFSPGTLATYMRITPRYLSSLFASTGTRVTNVILAYRLARAKVLLRDPANQRTQIGEIARLSGFRNQNYFTRCFREQEHVTPRQFRDRSMSSTIKNEI